MQKFQFYVILAFIQCNLLRELKSEMPVFVKV